MNVLPAPVRAAIGPTGLTDDELVAALLSSGGASPAFIYRAGMDWAAMGGTATRASTALYRDSAGIWQSAAIDVMRDGHYHYNGTANVRTLLREGAGTNSALGACLYADATYWLNSAGFTLAAATSCIAGQVATKHTSNNQTRSQNVGTFVNGQSDCFSLLIEQVSGSATARIVIYDSTAVAALTTATLTWATKAVAVVGGTAGFIDLGTGPTGAVIGRLWCTGVGTGAGTGAAGNTRTVYIYPTLDGSAQSAIIHHAQFEAATAVPSSPIVTVAGAVTRAADVISAPWSRVPEAGTFYLDGYDLTGSAGTPEFIHIGTAATVAYWEALKVATKWTSYAEMAAGTSVSAAAAAPAFGDRIELRPFLTVTGSNVTSTLGQSINGAAEAVAAAGTARALAATWAGSPPRLNIGSLSTGSLPANLAIRSILYVPIANYPQSACRQLAGT